MLKEMGLDVDMLGGGGFGDPELDALENMSGGDDEFAELNDLEGLDDEEESKAPPKKLAGKTPTQARQPDHHFEA